MGTCITSNINGCAGGLQGVAVRQVEPDYFDSEGRLLACHYPFVNEQFAEVAKRLGKDTTWFEPGAGFEKRKAAAKANGWEIGAMYSRCSTTMQDSYAGQIGSCIERACQRDTILIPELIAGDQGKTGKKKKRPGLLLFKEWLKKKIPSVALAFSVTRIARVKYKGMQFMVEEIFERGIRGLTIAENIDTNTPGWKRLAELSLLASDILMEANPFFVRMGQKATFEAGFQVGACSLGYRPVEVAGAGVTKRGKPKTRPEIIPEVAALIVKHYELIAGGMTLSEGCRLWNREIATWPSELRKFAVDPRTQTGRMRPEAYRRIFTRKKYIAIWEHGRKRNQWMDSKDGAIQVDAPDTEVVITIREDLRIVSDELFHRVQRKLAEGTRGRHGPRSEREPSLSTSLISLFRCSECGHVFHYYGQQYAHCPESRRGGCTNWGTIDREKATSAIILALREQVLGARPLVDEIIRQSREVDAEEDGDDLAQRIAVLEQGIQRQDNLMIQLEETCADAGMDLGERKRHKAAKLEKVRLEAELVSLKARKNQDRKPITEGEVLSILDEFDTLLEDAGAGKLADDDKQRAVILIRDLTGGRIDVSFTRLQGRRAFGVGKFLPNPFLALAKRDGITIDPSQPLPEVSVSFRELPRYERIADEVYRLRTEDGLSFTEIGKRFNIGSGNAWGAYAYWHTARGLPVPYKRAGVIARNRKSAS